jgi:hypothetical protein
MLLYVLFVSFFYFPFILGNSGQSPNPSDILAIKQTLNLYPLAIDGKNFTTGLPTVFTDDAVADYGPPFGVLRGVHAIIDSLTVNLANWTTQHSLTTQVINILDGEKEAETVTYLVAVHFGKDGTIYEGLYNTARAKYEDKLRVDKDGTWKIYIRNEFNMVRPRVIVGKRMLLIR